MTATLVQSPQEILANLIDSIDAVIQSGQNLDPATISELTQMITGLVEQIQGEQQQPQPEAPEQQNVPIGSELLWILSGGDPVAFTNYLRTYPDPEMNTLAQNPAALNFVIAQLRNDLPQNRTGEEDGIPQAPLQSSNIYGFQYDPKSKKLLVRFQEGNIYQYDNVPPQVYKAFEKGAVPAKTEGANEYGAWYQGKIPSLGAAFYELIRKGGYNYTKLT